MKTFILLFFFLASFSINAQIRETALTKDGSGNFPTHAPDENSIYSNEPVRFIYKNHDPDFAKRNKLPTRSFYKSRPYWQHIIDSTWGPGDSLARKLLIFQTYAERIRKNYDGFLALQLNWHSLYDYHINQINDSTSKGTFSSIMSHFANELQDMHTYAFDETVVTTPLNPGVPVLLLCNFITIEHFGAFTTVLPDSTILVLRAVANHPLNLEPGDIILGYEGVPWKKQVFELLDAGLPVLGATAGCKSAVTYHTLIGAGLNWHLFDTMDIVKYSTGDTVHLSVLPMLNLNIAPVVNNEQLAIPNIPFPNPAGQDTCVTYGILENTNIGYIFLASHWPSGTAESQLYEAFDSLKNTDALIIDMRFCLGGWAMFRNAFDKLFHESQNTLNEAYRCSSDTYDLCPSGIDWKSFKIDVDYPDYYDRPIAVLLGPSGYSNADITAQRLRYHPMIKFFGASPDASFGFNSYVTNFPGWGMRYSIADAYHMSEPGVYLNKKEFPLDFPVWFNKDDVAAGVDPVVEKSLEWIGNLAYGRNVITDKLLYSPGDTVAISATVENPNSHQVSAMMMIEDFDGAVVDSVIMNETPSRNEWAGKWITPAADERTFWLSMKVQDHTNDSYFTSSHSTRITTIPLRIDSLEFSILPNSICQITPHIFNAGSSQAVTDIKVTPTCSDTWVNYLKPAYLRIDSLLPGQTKDLSFIIKYDTAACPGNFNLTFTITSDCWSHWIIDRNLRIEPLGINEEPAPLAFSLDQNYPNPFYPATMIAFNLPQRSFVTLKIYDLRGTEIATIISEELAAGEHIREWKATNLPAGLYLYKLQAGSSAVIRKLVLMK